MPGKCMTELAERGQDEPRHPIPRGHAGPNLPAMVLEAKFGQHLPLNRQSETYGREGVELSVSALADWVGTAAAVLSPLPPVSHEMSPQ